MTTENSSKIRTESGFKTQEETVAGIVENISSWGFLSRSHAVDFRKAVKKMPPAVKYKILNNPAVYRRLAEFGVGRAQRDRPLVFAPV